MALNVTTTVSDIVAGLNAQDRNTATETDRWTAVITALYNRIKADMEITTQIAAGQPVTIPSTAATGSPSTGDNSAPWTGIANGTGTGSIS